MNQKYLLVGIGALAWLGAPAPGDSGSDLFEPPVRIEAAGKPIDVDIGHAAPCLQDIDGDGSRELLVGQFGDGKLLIFKNVGTPKAPKWGAPQPFMAGGAEGTVPAG
jgi:hypothetical protein